MAIRATRRIVPGGRSARLGSVRKLVVSGLGCACRKPLGQDVTSDPNIYDLPGLNVPANTTGSDSNIYNLPGLTTGPVYPSIPLPNNPNAYAVPGMTSIYTAPTSAAASSTLLPGLSNTTVFLAGFGLVLVMLVSGGGKRR